MTFSRALLRDVRFECQVDRLKRQLAIPNTRSACVEKVRFHWVERPFDAMRPQNTKLEPEDVVNIHRLLGLGASVAGVAQKYHMRVRQIERIRDGKAWKSLWPGASQLVSVTLGGEETTAPRSAQFVNPRKSGDGRAHREARLERHAALRD